MKCLHLVMALVIGLAALHVVHAAPPQLLSKAEGGAGAQYRLNESTWRRQVVPKAIHPGRAQTASGIVHSATVGGSELRTGMSGVERQGATPGMAKTPIEYRVLATNKTSTMQKEMNEAADSGFRFAGVMGGETSFGGSEVVVIMATDTTLVPVSKCEYRLLATSKTSTMQKELQEAGNAGFEYRGQTVFKSSFGGKEVVSILERDREQAETPGFEYRLLATKKTSTMQKELSEAAEGGFIFVGMTVAETLMGGVEVVTIVRRRVTR